MDKLNYFLENYKINFSENTKYQIVVDLGTSKDNLTRFDETVNRFKSVSDYLFKNKETYVVLIRWDAKSEEDYYGKASQSIEVADEKYDLKPYSKVLDLEFESDDEIVLLYHNSYSYISIEKIVRGLAGFDLALDEGLNLTAYFISFEKAPFLVNMYDDRGLEILTNDDYLNKQIRERFMVD